MGHATYENNNTMVAYIKMAKGSWTFTSSAMNEAKLDVEEEAP